MTVKQLIRYVSAYYENWNRELEERYISDFDISLKERVGSLSPGQRQKVAILLATGFEPELLILDEPSLGLAPNLVKDAFQKLVEINKTRKITMLIVEQKVNEILNISDRVYSIKLGRVAFEGRSEELKGNKKKLNELFL